MTSELFATDEDIAAVTRLIGRAPQGRFEVVVRRADGSPVVIKNAPRMDDGTPMPTMLWLVDAELTRQVATIESAGGVRRIEALVAPDVIASVHDDYAARRAQLYDAGGPASATGGVGGTRTGVKCLHAHLANHLAGAIDPVGAIVAAEVDLGELVPAGPSRDRLST